MQQAVKEKLVAMDGAALHAWEVLRDLEKDGRLAPGIKAVRTWWLQNYRQAGHKRLGQCLIGELSVSLADWPP
ncbi:MAG: hypothetical protein FJ039_05680 [Chloroflexi bacterium]|nr:hypothetical protein [Chloroflexota bacterium]